MSNREKTSFEVINALMRVMGTGVLEQLSNEMRLEAAQALKDASDYLKKHTGDVTSVHKGYVQLESQRIEVEFIVPEHASASEKDAYFVSSLAEKIRLGHTRVQSICL